MRYTPKNGLVTIIAAVVMLVGVKYAEAQFVSPTCTPPNCNPQVIQNIELNESAQPASFNITGDGGIGDELQVGRQSPVLSLSTQNLIYGNVGGTSTLGNLMLLQKGGVDVFRIGVNGSMTATGPMTIPNGTVGAPSLNFVSQPTTGFYYGGGSSIGVSVAGGLRATFSSNSFRNIDGTAAVPGYTFINDTNTGMYRIAADTLGFSTAGVESFRVNPDRSVTFQGDVTVNGNLNADISGDGSQITNINASNITTGTVDSARLPATVAYTDAANVFSVNQQFSGNVGIGTAPTAPFHLLSALATAGNNGLEFCNGTCSHIFWGATKDWYIRPGNVATGRIIIADTGGNVGIGTTSPSAKLQINPATSQEGLRIVSASDWSPLTVRNSVNSADIYRVDQAGILQVGSVPWARLTSLPSACPAGQYASALGGSLTCSVPPGNQNVFLTMNAPGGTDPVADSTTDTLNFANGAGISITGDATTDTMTVTNTGDTNAADDLTGLTAGAGISIAGSAPNLTVTNTGDTNASDDITGSGSVNYVSKFTGAQSVGNSIIYENGTNVGIGTTSPGSKLSVNGDISGAAISGYTLSGSAITGQGSIGVSGYGIAGANIGGYFKGNAYAVYAVVDDTDVWGETAVYARAEGPTLQTAVEAVAVGTSSKAGSFTATGGDVGSYGVYINATGSATGLRVDAGSTILDDTLTVQGKTTINDGLTVGTYTDVGSMPGDSGSTNGRLYYNYTSGKLRCYEGGAWKNCIGGVSSVSGSGAGISVSPTIGNVVVQNTGVTSALAGTGISVSGGTGAVTITNTGVIQVSGGTGISAVTVGGISTVTNTGDTNAADDITGSGMTGYVPVFVGLQELGNSRIWQTAINIGISGPVGINNSPTYDFDVAGKARVTDVLGVGTAPVSGYGIRSYGTTAGGYFKDTDDTSDAFVGYSGYGIYARGVTYGGYFSDNDSASYARAAYDIYGLYASGSQVGVYGQGVVRGGDFYDTSGTAHTLIAGASYGVEIITGNAIKPSGTAWLVSSDRRVKKDVSAFADGLDVIRQLNPVNFTYNGLGRTTDGLESIGLIAQDVKDVVPYMIGTREAPLHSDDQEDTELYTLDLSAMPLINLNAIKELDIKIDEMGAKVNDDSGRIETLERQMKYLEERLTELEKQAH